MAYDRAQDMRGGVCANRRVLLAADVEGGKKLNLIMHVIISLSQ